MSTYTTLLNFKYYFIFFRFSDLFNPLCYPVYLVLRYFYSPITTAQKHYCSTGLEIKGCPRARGTQNVLRAL